MTDPADREIVFRPATEADEVAICDLINSREELFLVYPGGRFPLTPRQLRELAQCRRALTVGETSTGIVAFANLYNFIDAQHAFIGNLIVARHWRGRGVGRALLAHMVHLAGEEYGLEEVRISVFADNTPAVLLYAAEGFLPFDVEERRDPDGHRRALLHMQKCLTRAQQHE
ncbi:MAG TPA: N-acetyltransferase [Gammaproteobacteria bacterium]|nr:N-acetyltransferase [Gammaproteobacteria bacterium]